MTERDADVAILGSGFAGSLTALILDRLGLRPVLIDRATHPRFAIGESSTPMADMILRDLADRYTLPRLKPLSTYGTWQETYPHLAAGRKRGFSYFHHQPGQGFQPDPEHANELLVAASSDAYYCDTHWLRADVDAFLAEEVRRAGIPFFENTEITTLRPDDGWRLLGQRGHEPLAIQADFLIDATGAAGVVPQALGLEHQAATFRTRSRALYGHFAGVGCWHDRLAAQGGLVIDHPFPCDHAALHHVLDGAWWWMLRFNNDVVSAGLVLDERRYPLDAAIAPEEEWSAWLQRYPSLRDLFAAARLLDPPGALIRTGRLQRRCARAAGGTWALLPHTAGFVDPLHSTGIAHSLCGVERLTGILARHWGSAGLEAALYRYEQALFRECSLIDRLVAACYASFGSFRLFAASAMLYFAAVITYERQRAGRSVTTPPDGFTRLFLCADDEALCGVVDEALARLARMDDPPSTRQVTTFEQYVEAALEPYNTAGLFHPAVPNMYHHTAAPV